MGSSTVALIPGLPQYELPAIGSVSEIEPVGTVLEKRRTDNLSTSRSCIDAGNQNIHLALGLPGRVCSGRLPVEPPEGVQAVDGHSGFEQADFGLGERLPDAVRCGYLVTICHYNLQAAMPHGC